MSPTKSPTKIPTQTPILSATVAPTLAPAPYVIFNATFDQGSDGFNYRDDGFRGTNRPSHANAFTQTTFDYREVIGVKLGFEDNVTVSNLSGGWFRNFTLAQTRNVSITITYQLQQSAFYESNEISEALCSIDNVLISNNTAVDYLAQIVGDGDGGVIGFTTTTINMLLSTGTHTLLIGGYVSSRSDSNEETWIRFDEVTLWAL